MNGRSITARGRLTLSKDILDHLGVAPGGAVFLDKLPHGRVLLRAGAIADVFGALNRENGPRLTTEEIDQIAAEGWSGER